MKEVTKTTTRHRSWSTEGTKEKIGIKGQVTKCGAFPQNVPKTEQDNKEVQVEKARNEKDKRKWLYFLRIWSSY